MHKLRQLVDWIRRQPRWRLWVAVGGLVVAVWWVWQRGESAAGRAPTFTAQRGPLEITVLEGGSLQALESQEIKCEVRVGYQGTKILKIVEEGYLVTEEDVQQGKVLVELDSSELEKQIAQQEIQFQSALANLTDAQQNYEIQLNQNQSDIKAAEQKVRFARMDFDKFLGDSAAAEIVHELGLDRLLAEASSNPAPAALVVSLEEYRPAGNQPTNAAGPRVERRPGTNAPAMRSPPVASGPNGGEATSLLGENLELPREASFQLPSTAAIDFSKYARVETLGDGEAKQKLRKFEDDLQVAQKELGQATATLEGTRRLFAKGFVTKTDLQRDEIAYDNARLKVQTAETARSLYLKYDFAKSAEESLSRYLDAVRDLDKTRRLAISRLAQAEARLRSALGQYQVQRRQRNDLREQLEKCTIRARKPGLVVYGGGRDESFFRGEEMIREGATVRERQAIITIPDMTRMAVNVKIHETYINKLQRGQKARIIVDAFPDKTLTGEVNKVALLPDSQNRWMNPDLKVYGVTVAIDGSHEWIRPGMSARVEILVNRLADVVYIPIQAVLLHEGKQVCYVLKGAKPERREVEIGEFTDEFIEIRRGLREGEVVLLRPPGGVESERSREKKPEAETEPSAPGASATPTAHATERGAVPTWAAVVTIRGFAANRLRP